jgi:CheY-like chemotaxis protein
VKILVVDPHAAEREATLRLFAGSQHCVSAAVDAASAVSACARRQADVLVVEQGSRGHAGLGLDLVRQIRERESKDGRDHVFIVATASRTRPGDVSDAFGAGADDFVRKPITREELLARVDGINRIRKWASRQGTSADGELALGGPMTLRAWQTLEPTLTAEIGTMIGKDLAVAEWEPEREPALYARIPMHLASEGFQLSLSVGIERATQVALAAALLEMPQADEAALRDMLREFVNTAGGAFKRTAAAEGRLFSLGLPVDQLTAPVPAQDACAHREWLARGEEGLAVRFRAELRAAQNKLVAASSLREQMVLVQDLLNARGALLLPRGTCLTESHLAHLTKALGPTTLIEVAGDAT